MGCLDSVPLPNADVLLGTSAALELGVGAATLIAPKKMHELYFKKEEDDDKTETSAVHKPTTRWLGMSLGWIGALNVAAALCPDGEAKKKLLIANGAGLLGGVVVDSVNLAKGTQKKKMTVAEIASIGTLGTLSIARAVKGWDKKTDESANGPPSKSIPPPSA